MPSDEQRVLDLIKDMAGYAFLATCDRSAPAVRWVSPIIEDLSMIWVATFSNADKVKQIRANPRIALLFTSLPSGDQSVSVRGRASIVEDPDEKKRVWAIAPVDLSRFLPDGPDSAAYGLLRIFPEVVQWRDSWEGETKTLRSP